MVGKSSDLRIECTGRNGEEGADMVRACGKNGGTKDWLREWIGQQ